MAHNLPPGCKLSDLPGWNDEHYTGCPVHEDQDHDEDAECECPELAQQAKEDAAEAAFELARESDW